MKQEQIDKIDLTADDFDIILNTAIDLCEKQIQAINETLNKM